MKLIFSLATLLFAFSVHAADRKLGNVIAVERDVTNIYNSCTSNVIPDPQKTKSAALYSCSVPVLKDGDASITRGTFLNGVGQDCIVDGEVGNGSLVIEFSTSAENSSYTDSQACLKRALDAINNDTKLIIYTVE